MADMDINYLGDFTDLQSVWKRFPSGGCKGDYVKVAGIYVYWDEYRSLWGDPEDMSCDNIYSSLMGSLIVKGRVHLVAVPPFAGTQTVSGSLIVPVFDTATGKWNFINATAFGVVETVIITASVNSFSLSQGYIKCGDKRSDPSTGILEITAPKGSDVILEFTPNAGFEVSNVTIDETEQGIITQYTLISVQEDHSVNVWYKESAEIPEYTDFLQRSDLEGVYYSSLHTAMAAVKNDYPDGLTQDVTISCVKAGTEYRNPTDTGKNQSERIWTAAINNWNKGTQYTLTIDGQYKYTISAYSLGGVSLRNVDNIIFRNMAFTDYSNFSKGSTAEEMAAIYSIGAIEDKNKNIVIINCTFNGQSGNSLAWYGIDCKLTSNVIIDKCTMVHAGGRVIKVTDVDVLEITNSSLSGDSIYSMGHSNLLYATGAKKCLISDCDIDGDTFTEYVMQFVGFTDVSFKRCRIHNCSGQPVLMQGNEKIDILFESCLIDNNMKAPKYLYCKFFMRANQPVRNLTIRNNTVYLNGKGVYYQEGFSVDGNIDSLNNNNNIYIDASAQVNAFVSVTGTVVNYNGNNNLYKAILYSTGSRFLSTKILSIDMLLNGKDARDLTAIQTLGIESGSTMLANTVNVLNVETGAADYKLIDALSATYPAVIALTPKYDKEYKLMTDSPNIGCYNNNGSVWDETTDTSTGYAGLHDFTHFSEAAAYTLPSDDIAVLSVNCDNRNMNVKTKLTYTDSSLMFYGRNIVFTLQCRVNDNTGANVTNTPYSVLIEKF